MAIVAGAIHLIARMFELLAVGRQQFEIFAAALRKNRVTGVAVVGVYYASAIRRFVHSVVATEASGPILVANVIGICFPARLHLREEVVFVDLLDGLDSRAN